MKLPGFLRRSLRRKVTALVTAATLAALLLAGGAMFFLDTRDYRATRLADLRTNADIIGRASVASLVFADPKDAEASLKLLRALPTIGAAAIYRADGTLFAAYRGEGHDVPSRAGRGHRVEGSRILFFHAIEEQGETVGTVFLDAYDGLADRMAKTLAILAVVTAGALLTAFSLSAWLQRAVTDPILDVAAAARRVLERGEFSTRARKSADDETGALADAFNRMLAEIESRTSALSASEQRAREAADALLVADRRKDEFLATLAHELRNPLAPLAASVALLRRIGGSEPQLVWARDVIERQVRHMARLLDDLLDVGRITNNKLELRRQRVTLASVIEAAIETSRPLIDKGRHRLAVQLPAAEVLIDGDPVRLAQVFANLLNNAARYTDEGGEIGVTAEVTAGVAPAAARTQAAPGSAATVTVTVRDNGIGIAPADLPRIFEIFAQSTPALVRRQGGLGIGLFLVHRLVELHGGSVSARSGGPGQGTEFTVRLPVSETPAPAGHAAPVGAAGAGAGAGAGEPGALRILVADDNADAAESMAALLRSAGHEVRVAHDGQEAVEAAARWPPEVVLLDVGMPRLNGYEAARQLRRQPRGREMLLIAVTGWGQQDDRRRAFEAGFDGHLTKPAQLEDIEALIARAGAGAPG